MLMCKFWNLQISKQYWNMKAFFLLLCLLLPSTQAFFFHLFHHKNRNNNNNNNNNRVSPALISRPKQWEPPQSYRNPQMCQCSCINPNLGLLTTGPGGGSSGPGHGPSGPSYQSPQPQANYCEWDVELYNYNYNLIIHKKQISKS